MWRHVCMCGLSESTVHADTAAYALFDSSAELPHVGLCNTLLKCRHMLKHLDRFSCDQTNNMANKKKKAEAQIFPQQHKTIIHCVQAV